MKKGILFLALISLTLLWTGIAGASELTDDYLDIANNYFNSNNRVKAVEYLDLVIKLEPKNVKAKTLKDKILIPKVCTSKVSAPAAPVLRSGETTKAPVALETPVTVNTCTTTTAATATVTPPSEPNPTPIAIAEVPKVNVETVTYNSGFYNTKGLEFYQKKDFNSAIEFFYKAIFIDKNNAQAYNNLAMAYYHRNNPDFAIKFFKKANLVDKEYTQPLVNLSNLYKQMGDCTRQVYYLKKATAYNAHDYAAYFWLGEYYRSIGQYCDAVQNYKNVVAINPKFAPVYLTLTMSFLETEDYNYAQIAIKQYQETYPNSDYAFYLKAKTSFGLGNYYDAKTYIQQAIQIKDTIEYQLELAKIYYALADYTSAINSFQNVLKNGENAEYYNYIGNCNYKLKNNDAAIDNFKKAILLDGLRPIYYYNLALVYKAIGDNSNYTKNLDTAIKISPMNYQDFIDLSSIYSDNKNSKCAIEILNKGIKKFPCVKALYLAKLKVYSSIDDDVHYNETQDLIDMRFNKYEKK